MFAAGVVAGVGYGAVSRLPAAGAAGCALWDPCADQAEEAGKIAAATCAAESPADQRFCYAQAEEIFQASYWQCTQQNNVNNCDVCEFCTNGECQPYCTLSCRPCDRTSGVCVDTCPEDQWCDVSFGVAQCVPKCPQSCAPYDPYTNGCVDQCTAKNPCMKCYQGVCQSNCPNPADYCDGDGVCKPCDNQECRHIEGGKCVACEPGCEECVGGTCQSLCGESEICCAGICISCCGGYCDSISQSCVSGTPCSDGESCCSGNCTNLQTDRADCGTCGNVCPPSTPVCDGGQCRACASDSDCNGNALTCCPDGCDNLQSDPNNCGTCGNVCPSGEACSQGQCVQCQTNADCGPGQTCCSAGGCKNLQTDFNNCGSCGYACYAEASTGCVNGVCMCGNQPACTGTDYCCNDQCVDTAFDSNNCGGCGIVCPSSEICCYGYCTSSANC